MPLEALSREKHKNLRLQPIEQPWAFARELTTVGVVGAEFPELVRVMPIAFRLKDGVAHMLAVMGLGKQNLFVSQQGTWQGTYIPAALRAWPFSLIRQNNKHIVAINVDAPVLSTSNGEALFTDNGEPAERLAKTIEFLQAVGDQEVAMNRAVAAIVDANVLVPWEFEIRNAEGKTVRITGLHQVDHKAIDALDDAAFLKLRTAGALPLVYGHWFSQRNVPALERLAQQRRDPAANDNAAPALPQALYITDEYLKF